MQGLLLAGRYRLVESIGSGGMGRVWRAHDEVLHRAVAIKELTAALYVAESELATLLARTHAEARAAARINHSAVVTVHDVLEYDYRPWIVMELVDGNSLADEIRDRGRVEPAEAARIGLWVLRGLRAAHTAGVLHRDVKPGNVLISNDRRVLLTDFGIAQVEGATTITRTGEIVGSVDYLAPERVRGHEPGPASDLWALGATLYTAVEGKSPFRRTTPLTTMQAVVREEPEPSRYAGALGPVITALLHKDPAVRPSATEAEQMLAEAAEGRRPSAAQAYVPTQHVDSAAADRSSRNDLGDPGSFGDLDGSGGQRRDGGPGVSGGDQSHGAGLGAAAAAGGAYDGDGASSGATPHGQAQAAHASAGHAPTAHAPTAHAQADHPSSSYQSSGYQSSGHPSAGHPSAGHTPLGHTPAGHTPAGHDSGPYASVSHGTTGSPYVVHPPSTPTPVPGSAGSGKRGRGRTIALVVVLAALVGGGGAVALKYADGWGGGSGAVTSSEEPPDTGQSDASGSPQASADPSSGSSAGAVPDNWVRVEDVEGFSLAVPKGWKREANGSQVDYTPDGGDHFVRIAVDDSPDFDNPYMHQLDLEQQLTKLVDYRRVSLEANTFRDCDGALWDFTWTALAQQTEFPGPRRAIEQTYLARDGIEYVIYMSAPAEDWDTARQQFDAMLRSWRPAAG
ncbi:protein kinase [Streptomyces sp. NPDC127072]|uniref:serine/threonine protein kinase n=1 Tax=Streptomyces sp. NPDC127072 TaxID=3347129 RepID=UPI00365D2457